METTKKCTKCGKTRSVKCYGKNKRVKNGLRSHCNICRCGLTQRLVRRYNKDGVLVGGLVLWFAEKRGNLSKYSANWLRSKGLKYCGCCGVVKPLEVHGHNKTCKECINLRSKAWREAHKNDPEYKAKNKARSKAHYETYKGHYIARQKAYYEANKNDPKYKAENRARTKAYREANKDKIKEYQKAYCQSEHGKAVKKAVNHNRRAMKRALPRGITADDLKTVSEVLHGQCAYTGKPIEEQHDDHVIPLGVGYGGSIVSNMVPAESSINESKGAKNVFEFVEELETQGVNTAFFYDKTLPYIVEEYREYIEDEDLYIEEYAEYVNYCHDNPRTVEEVRAEKKARKSRKSTRK